MGGTGAYDTFDFETTFFSDSSPIIARLALSVTVVDVDTEDCVDDSLIEI